MQIKKFQGKTKDDLVKILHSLKERQQELKFKLASNQLAHVREVREVKREIARVNTALNQLVPPTKDVAGSP
ncbi:50S ribosomal protein L29, partial [Patescibacteria group bacterium]|nr:50S ribosomal protein L29 [Patescibacteria group bacterium]